MRGNRARWGLAVAIAAGLGFGAASAAAAPERLAPAEVACGTPLDVPAGPGVDTAAGSPHPPQLLADSPAPGRPPRALRPGALAGPVPTAAPQQSPATGALARWCLAHGSSTSFA